MYTEILCVRDVRCGIKPRPTTKARVLVAGELSEHLSRIMASQLVSCEWLKEQLDRGSTNLKILDGK